MVLWKVHVNVESQLQHWRLLEPDKLKTIYIYEKWLQRGLIPCLTLNSITVIGSAVYHSVFLECTPSVRSRNVDMINWVSSHGIPYSHYMLKPQQYR